MPRAIKSFSFVVAFLVANPAFALTQEQVSAIQDYLTERAGGGKGGHPMREAQLKLDEIEKKLLPLIFVFKRTGPLVDSRVQEIEALQTALSTGQLDFNPYEETDWLKSKSRETVQICCLIRNDQRMAQSIQENVARGFPPISAQALEQISARIREANRDGGGGLILEDDVPAVSSREIPAARFKPSTRQGGSASPAQKMLDNIGYSDKPAQAPPAPAQAPPASAPAPANAATPPVPAGAPTPPAEAGPPAAGSPPAPAPAPAPEPAPSP